MDTFCGVFLIFAEKGHLKKKKHQLWSQDLKMLHLKNMHHPEHFKRKTLCETTFCTVCETFYVFWVNLA